MNIYDQRLRELTEKVKRKTHLEAMINELSGRKSALEAKAEELREVMNKEEADVQRLEKGGLKVFLYEIIGKSEEKLEKEKEEAYAAAVKYNSAVKELSDLIENINVLEAELKPLWYAEEDYEKAYSEKRNALKESGNPQAEELLENERVLQFLLNEEKELKEAVMAGKKAQRISEHLVSALEDAEHYSYLDIATRSSFSSFRKYDILEEAAELSQQLSSALNNFKAELADVEIYNDMDITVDSDARFMDWLFDNFFTDYRFLNNVKDLLSDAQKLKSDISYALAMLSDKLDENNKEQTEQSKKLEAIVLNSEL